jgi:hypothetical protein
VQLSERTDSHRTVVGVRMRRAYGTSDLLHHGRWVTPVTRAWETQAMQLGEYQLLTQVGAARDGVPAMMPQSWSTR